MRGPMELGEVRGWRTPPPLVDIPIFALSGWTGPQWLLLYDGNQVHDGKRETGLRLVELAFGDLLWPPDPRGYIDVTTYAKLPAHLDASGAGTAKTTFADVASGAPDRADRPSRCPSARRGRAHRALRHDLNQQLSKGGAVTFGDGPLPERWWRGSRSPWTEPAA